MGWVPVELSGYRTLKLLLQASGRAKGRVDFSVEFGSAAPDVVNATLRPSERVPPRAHAGGGHGLVGMRHRAESLGGSCGAGRRPDGTWQGKVTLPICVAG